MQNFINPIPNRKFKDKLFCSIFGIEEHKHYLLELYNALNKSHHTNIDDLELTTIENVIYITMHNDVSFLIETELNLYEQQSTYNPNMPLRGFFYFAQLYQMWLTKKGKDLFSSIQTKIPTPQFIVFYNGEKETADSFKLKLSDMFEKSIDSNDFEWTATVININKNHNSELQKSCKALYNYVEFISLIKENLKNGDSKNKAIEKALNFAINHNFLDGYFKEKKMEVLDLSLTEFDEEEFIQNRREEGIIIGVNKANNETALNLLKMNVCSEEQISQATGLSIQRVKELRLEMSN